MLVFEVVTHSHVGCRRDSVLRTKKPPGCALVPTPTAAVRRSRRLPPRIERLGDFQDPKEMEGESESVDTKTEDEYSPGEYPSPK